MVRVFHTSDTHLGHQQYTRTDEAGFNQREQDIYAAWHKVIDAAVAEHPDLFVHAGDLFDGVRPSNRALAHAMEGFLKLSASGIPTIVIAGNHETPRLRETGSPFRIFSHLPGIHVVFRGARETFDVGDVRVHAVPQCQDNDALGREVTTADLGPAANLLVVHGAVPAIEAFRHGEFHEQEILPSWFAPFDYVALGHHHGVREVAGNAWYCGAPERVSMAEAGEEKGFLDVEIRRGHAKAKFRPLEGRTYVDLPVLDAGGWDAAQTKAAAIERLTRQPPGAIVRLRIDSLNPALRGTLDVRAIRAAGAHLGNLDLRLTWLDPGLLARGATELRGLEVEFEAFLATQPLEGADRARLLALGRSLLGGPA